MARSREAGMGEIHIVWKKNFNPELLLKKIDNVKKVIEINGKAAVSYAGGYDFHDAMASLSTMVSFPEKTKSLHKEEIISKAIHEVAKLGELTKDKVLVEMKKLAKEQLSVKEQSFHVLTSISLRKPYLEFPFENKKLQIHILDAGYPDKYTGREDIIRENQHYGFQDNYRNYANVIIQVKAKSEREAMLEALDFIDLQRSVWCLLANYSVEYFTSDTWQPINKIRLGQLHTLHRENGALINENFFWYEPNFIKRALYFPENTAAFNSHIGLWGEGIKSIKNVSYRKSIYEALIRYVRALDERDPSIAMVKLWGALESLIVLSQNAQYELIIRRVSYLFAEREYHQQVLEHLREYRNSNIHSGEEGGNPRNCCYQMQYYFKRLITFHLAHGKDFSNLDEANSFLDLPANRETLLKRKKLIEKAIKFIEPPQEV